MYGRGKEVFKKYISKPGNCVPFISLISFFKKDLRYFKIFIYLIYLFLAALGLRCCARALSSCGERGLLSVVVRGLLIAVASLCYRARALGAQASVVVARGLSGCGSRALERRLSSCGAWA